VLSVQGCALCRSPVLGEMQWQAVSFYWKDNGMTPTCDKPKLRTNAQRRDAPVKNAHATGQITC
jgi:hypothetical protein